MLLSPSIPGESGVERVKELQVIKNSRGGVLTLSTCSCTASPTFRHSGATTSCRMKPPQTWARATGNSTSWGRSEDKGLE